MAKGQKRSSKEPRKPKQPIPKAVASVRGNAMSSAFRKP